MEFKPSLSKILLTLFLIIPAISFAHSGRTNSKGCHTNKKTGEYHCHNKKLAPAPVEQAEVLIEYDKPETKTNIMRLDYEGFTIWLDCSKRAATKFRYNAQRDTGNHKRLSKFSLDENVPKNCQQLTGKAYGSTYDRGHLVPANHLDFSSNAIKQSNLMTNIMPQHKNMNRGAWLQTEMITECYRDIDELLILGGVIWGNNQADDYFLNSHGVVTPDAFYKVIIRGAGANQRAIAWIIPNIEEAKRKNLDSYLVTIKEIEKTTGEIINVADYAKYEKPSTSWQTPKGCDKS